MEFSDAEYQAEEAGYKGGVIDALNILSDMVYVISKDPEAYKRYVDDNTIKQKKCLGSE